MEIRKVCMRCGSTFAAEAEFCPHDGNKLIVNHEVPDPLLGTTLLEQFEIRAIVGSGGMGTVYRAHQTTTDRDVAIKVLRPELARDDESVLRFKREARVATGLDHPNLVNVFLSGQLPDGRLYIVMELLDGRSLADVLDETPLLELERCLKILLKLGAGVGAMHAQEVIHRDIKPENVFLVKRGADPEFAKLVDFGIARNLESGFTSTKNGRVFGTANYISPEAASGDPVDQRSDIYSLGVLAYQLFTGELPFDGETAGAVLLKHVNNPAPHVHTKGHGERVPHEVADVVMRALSKDPNERPQSTGQLIEELASAAAKAGLLEDAHSLLLGTMWHDELTTPGASLANILSEGNGKTPQLELIDEDEHQADEELYPIDALSESDEAFLSSAPDPFGTSTGDVPALRANKRSRMLWTVLGGLVLILGGVVAFSWWSARTPTAAANGEEAALPAPADSVGPQPTVPEPDVSLSDSVAVVDMPAAPIDGTTTAPPAKPAEPEKAERDKKPRAKPKPKRVRRAPEARPSTRTPKPAPAPSPTPEPAPAPPSHDEAGIDWTVPEFPEAETGPAPPPPDESEPPVAGDKPAEPAPAPAEDKPAQPTPPAEDKPAEPAPPEIIEDPPFVLPPP